jgi:hypothetical protein
MSAPLLRGLDSDHRRDRTSVKWVAYPPDVLPLWVAEMDAAPCPAVVDAVTSAMRRGDTGYGWGPRYAEAVARYADATWGWQVDTDASMIVPDVMIGASELLRLLTDEGGPVVISSPTYNAFYGFLDAIGRRTVDAPLTGDGRLDPEALRTAFREATARGERAAYLLCNPQNPTGTVHSRDELTTLAALADEFGVRVVADEIHAPIVFPGGPAFTPFLTVPGGERGFSVFSPSKGWNLAGLKSALVMAGPDASRRPRPPARGAHPRLVPHRGDRPRRRPGRRQAVVGPAAPRARRQPHPPGPAPRRAPARDPVAGPGRHLPRVAGLPRPRARRRPVVRVPPAAAGSPSGPGHSTARRPDGGSSGSTSRRRRRSSRTPWGACLLPCDSHKITER